MKNMYLYLCFFIISQSSQAIDLEQDNTAKIHLPKRKASVHIRLLKSGKKVRKISKLSVKEEQAFCLERIKIYHELGEKYKEYNWKSQMADAFDTEKQWIWYYDSLNEKARADGLK